MVLQDATKKRLLCRERKISRSWPNVNDKNLPKDQYRIVVLGAAGVGKSSLLSRITSNSFSAKYKATVEDFFEMSYNCDGTSVKLEIIDTTGAYEFPAMRDLSISTGDAFILVYSFDDMNSFEEVRNIRQQIIDIKKKNQNNNIYLPIVVVANKTDTASLDPVQAATCDATVAIDWGHGYVEASAKNNTNTLAILDELFSQAKKVNAVDHKSSLPDISSTDHKLNDDRGKKNDQI